MNRRKPREMAREQVEGALARGHVQKSGGEGKPGTCGELKSSQGGR